MVPLADAYKLFQKKLPNGANVPGVEALGHEREAGGPNNDFGLDFVEAMFVWTRSFCEKDSDGDGQTNGQELGDPCCEFQFRQQEHVRWTQGVSHPGDPALKADPALWEGIECGVDAAPEAKEAEVAETKAAEKQPVETAVAHEPRSQHEFTAGAPALHASVMLSAAALAGLMIYVVAMRTRRVRSLPIFRQQRRG
ncbi:hypothetical protein PHMEG_00012541 [Phytophthora megakarya]|uniref:Temptin Cys/Cys disulfide domain-containing protein n=1 Tax=Phytophthora megakarya TaxID=4795 RepID=A0A225W9Z4_9STRA|nr:hypothetical protein PHMEG_00012541 [Phytophthora megakarya]